MRERVGSLAQVARIDSFIEADGAARGSRRIRMVNGGGLEVELHPDRALDIGNVTVGGVPVAWISPVGVNGPESYNPQGNEWLRTFGGGLLVTCGLDSFGPPSEDDFGAVGLHGRIGAARATILRSEVTSEEVVVEAEVRQAAVFGENLVLRRRISSPLGSDVIRIEDTVTNESFREQPHMILYHFNLGWPLVDDDTAVSIPSVAVTPRDRQAENGLSQHAEIGAPVAGFREQVFRHDLADVEQATASVHNPRNGLRAQITVDPRQLPSFYQWKMVGQGHYVLGIEPANTPQVGGRVQARDEGELPYLAPGQSAHYEVIVRLSRESSTDPAPEKKEAA